MRHRPLPRREHPLIQLLQQRAGTNLADKILRVHLELLEMRQINDHPAIGRAEVTVRMAATLGLDFEAGICGDLNESGDLLGCFGVGDAEGGGDEVEVVAFDVIPGVEGLVGKGVEGVIAEGLFDLFGDFVGGDTALDDAHDGLCWSEDGRSGGWGGEMRWDGMEE